MALPTEIAVKMTEASDSIINQCQTLSHSKCFVSNQHDVDIVSRVCETVVSASLYICIAVVLCFLFTALFKSYAKKKDYNLEIERISNNEAIQEIERLNRKLEAEKKKMNEITNTKTELLNQTDLIKKVEDIINLGYPLSVTLKSGNLSMEVKTQASNTSGDEISNLRGR